MIKFSFSIPYEVRSILHQNNNLAQSPFSHIKMYDDKTPKQLSYLRDLRGDLKRRTDAGEANLTIRYKNGMPYIVEQSKN